MHQLFRPVVVTGCFRLVASLKSRKESIMAQHKKERTREIERRRRRREKRAKLRAKGLLPLVGASK
jgi:hypothetical protein